MEGPGLTVDEERREQAEREAERLRHELQRARTLIGLERRRADLAVESARRAWQIAARG